MHILGRGARERWCVRGFQRWARPAIVAEAQGRGPPIRAGEGAEAAGGGLRPVGAGFAKYGTVGFAKYGAASAKIYMRACARHVHAHAPCACARMCGSRMGTCGRSKRRARSRAVSSRKVRLRSAPLSSRSWARDSARDARGHASSSWARDSARDARGHASSRCEAARSRPRRAVSARRSKQHGTWLLRRMVRFV
eukprot:5582912-Prymnesium_polylepis.1